MNTVFDLDAWREQALEALEARSGIPFQPKPNGEIFTVPNPLLLDDQQNADLDRASGALAVATVLLGGPDVYGRFVAAGGRAGDVMMAWRVMQQNATLDPNSSAFTRSSADVRASSNPTSSTNIPASVVPSINGGAQSSPAPAN